MKSGKSYEKYDIYATPRPPQKKLQYTPPTKGKWDKGLEFIFFFMFMVQMCQFYLSWLLYIYYSLQK